MLSSWQVEPTPRIVTSKPSLGVEWATFCSTPWFATGTPRHRGAKAKGLRYEARVIDRVLRRLDENFWTPFDKTWLRYKLVGKSPEVCQPDLFLLNHVTGRLIVIEIKLSRSQKAWYQLAKYERVLQVIFPDFQIAKLEIASKVFAVDVPEKVRVVPDIYAARTGHTSFLKMPYDER